PCPLALRRQDENTLTAMSAVCTHAGCTVGLDGMTSSWLCPCHGSRFDLEGAVIGGPAPRPRARYKGVFDVTTITISALGGGGDGLANSHCNCHCRLWRRAGQTAQRQFARPRGQHGWAQRYGHWRGRRHGVVDERRRSSRSEYRGQRYGVAEGRYA